jgi:hypothetical protein
VEIDLLAGEYAGTGPGHRTQRVQDVHARKARGAELALVLATSVMISGSLPGGAHDTAQVRVAGIVPFLAMKGIALRDRMKEKDAYDVYFCLRSYPGGLDALAGELKPHMAHTVLREGLEAIALRFASPDEFGCRAVADFQGVADPEGRAVLQRDVYERVLYLLSALGSAPQPQ